MAELKAKKDEIDKLIKAIEKKRDAIDVSVSSIEEPSKSKGIMLTEYIKRIEKISDLLKNYKQLLDKDVSDINKSIDKILEMDKQMGKSF